MKAVGVKALKNELSRYLRAVRDGEVVLVLDRDEVIAELQPPSHRRLDDDRSWDAFVHELTVEGALLPARGDGTSTMSMRDWVESGLLTPVEDAGALIEAARRDRF